MIAALTMRYVGISAVWQQPSDQAGARPMASAMTAAAAATPDDVIGAPFAASGLDRAERPEDHRRVEVTHVPDAEPPTVELAQPHPERQPPACSAHTVRSSSVSIEPPRIIVTELALADGSVMLSSRPSGALQASTAARTASARTACRRHAASSPSSSIMTNASRRPNRCGIGGVPQ